MSVAIALTINHALPPRHTRSPPRRPLPLASGCSPPSPRRLQTYVGDILIAVNPFQMLGLYTNQQSALYCNVQSKSDFAPHLFAIADAAYNNMKRNGRAQVSVPCHPQTTDHPLFHVLPCWSVIGGGRVWRVGSPHDCVTQE
jgi:hypothetical protein